MTGARIQKAIGGDDSKQSVQWLDLNGRHAAQKIRTIENLEQMSSLTKLDLSSNAISKIQHLHHVAASLTDLNLADNRIARLENLGTLTRLTRLNLNGNAIARVPPSLAALQNLQELRLADNALSILNDVQHLRPLSNLVNLALHDNPMAALPHYRSFVVYTLPFLDILDGGGVSNGDRAAAATRFGAEEVYVMDASLRREMAEKETVLDRYSAEHALLEVAEGELQALQQVSERQQEELERAAREMTEKDRVLAAKRNKLLSANHEVHQLQEHLEEMNTQLLLTEEHHYHHPRDVTLSDGDDEPRYLQAAAVREGDDALLLQFVRIDDRVREQQQQQQRVVRTFGGATAIPTQFGVERLCHHGGSGSDRDDDSSGQYVNRANMSSSVDWEEVERIQQELMAESSSPPPPARQPTGAPSQQQQQQHDHHHRDQVYHCSTSHPSYYHRSK
jgi:hypothetical protein